MRRIGLAVVLALSLVFEPLVADAQQVGEVYRIGYMSIPSRQSGGDLIDQAVLPALRERGFVDGKNLVIEWRWAEGKPERLPRFAAELVALGVDLIVAPRSDSALAAKRATRTIPIVHAVHESCRITPLAVPNLKALHMERCRGAIDIGNSLSQYL